MQKRFAWGFGLVAVFVLASIAGFTMSPTPGPASAQASVENPNGVTFTFEGCWSYWSAGPCYDIYRDDAGNYWKCKKCGTTKNPPSGCAKISIQTLNTGYWCS